MKKSLIFTKTELKELQHRLEGNVVNSKIWYKVKLKLGELQFWFGMNAELMKAYQLDGRKIKRR